MRRDWKRWTVRYFSALDVGNEFNASGIASYLEENDFDGGKRFGTTLDPPFASAERGNRMEPFRSLRLSTVAKSRGFIAPRGNRKCERVWENWQHQ